MPPTTVTITGTILTPDGVGVENVLVTLEPAPASVNNPEVIGGVGIVSNCPAVTATDVNGEFSIEAIQGFRYTLRIESIGYAYTFTAPALSEIRFDMLGLTPEFESITLYTDANGVEQTKLVIKAPSINTVMERFEEIVLERSDTGPDGPYTELVISGVTPIRLQPGEFFYTVTIPGELTYYYRAFYRKTPDESLPSNYRGVGSDEEALVMSVNELKELYLFGVDLTDDAGNPYPDRMLSHYIKSAVKWLEKELDIPLVARNFVNEQHDHFASDYGRWGYFKLLNFPLIRVDKVSFQYPSMNSEVIIDPRWLVIEEAGESGVIQLVPGQGNIADVLLIPGMLMPMWSGATGRVPGVWRFDYRAGFEVGNFPADLKHVIGMVAAIGPLNIAGDLVAGAAIANFSIGVPGLSQSVGTTASATNAGYGARIIEYQKEIKEMMPLIRRYYGKGNRMVVA